MTEPAAATGPEPTEGPVPFSQALRAWAKVALHSFGGPAGQIAVIHRVTVEERRWVSEERFLHALSYCMLLPGPEAQQLATYLGWLLHGTRGALAAGLLFVLPGFVTILALSLVYLVYGDAEPVAAVFFGIKAAVLAIVFEAVLRLRRRALKGPLAAVIAGAAFVAIFFLAVPFPVIVAGAALAGLAALRSDAGAADDPTGSADPRPSVRRLLRTAAVWLAIWLVPVALLAAALGMDHILVREAVFFSKVAVMTFGGAYAVLAYVAQQAVEVHGWLTAPEMLDGLGLAETTPGPLIMVVQFVGSVAAFRAPAPFDPIAAAVAGAVVTTWVIFAPCFLFILAGAPYVEHLRGQRALNAALQGIMAAVVGVVLNLAVWFALHVLFAEVREVLVGPLRLWVPRAATLDVRAALIAACALVAALKYGVGLFPLLGGAVGIGLLLRMLG